MARRKSPKTAFVQLLNESTSPVYALSSEGKIVFCNRALDCWTGIAAEDLIGRQVVYHSADDPSSLPGIAAGLCPPPVAMQGFACTGHVSCPTRQGHLMYRRGHFEPLIEPGSDPKQSGVLAILAAHDLTPDEVTAQFAPDADSNVLHTAIRRFRRQQAENYDLAALIGQSPAMQTIRRQVAMAATTTGPVTLVGLPGTGREHIARAIHYHPPFDSQKKLIPLDGPVVDLEELRWSIETLRCRERASPRNTLLIRDLQHASQEVQNELLRVLLEPLKNLRVLVTLTDSLQHLAETRSFPGDLVTILKSLVIEIPPLEARRTDLPLLAQFFVEECNRDQARQIGGITQEATELLALYAWPRGVQELRDVIRVAYSRATQPEITAADLPAIIQHAATQSILPEREDVSIDLDKFLARIECELIERAICQAQGNKTQAAELLGISRPRFYRRLVQLGLDPLEFPSSTSE